jgi:DNA-binding CsgD family transcriptional regulator
MAARTGIWRFRAIADLSRIHNYYLLDLTEDAKRLLAALPEPSDAEDPVLRYSYYVGKGKNAASLGQSAESYGYFERAIAISTPIRTTHNTSSIWSYYALSAWKLGNINLAQKCFETCILSCREWQMDLGLAFIFYAKLLVTIGQNDAAREYLTKANAYAMRPFDTLQSTSVAIPLALRSKDAEFLGRFNRPDRLTQAFQDGNPTSIGNLAAAFSHLYASQGQHRRAKALLHRALGYIQGFHDNWDALLAIARYGSLKDTATAREVFASRIALPNNEVALATRELFDAYMAQRCKQSDRMRNHGTEAMRRFEALEWHGYADLTRELLQVDSRERTIRSPKRALAETPLTPRERQVAELVLKGRTNRDISSELEITENTVEKHLTAIIGRLGVRSRHQLAEAIETTDSVMRE